jgi:hypothetical protein
MGAGAPVRVQTKLAGKVVQQEQQVGLIGHDGHNKQRYVRSATKLSCIESVAAPPGAEPRQLTASPG